MRTQLEQQYEANGSTSGGPRVPVPVHPLIQTAYASVFPQDQFINNWETSSELTISGMTRSSDGSDDHVISYKSSICAFTASVTGNLSANFIVIGTLLSQRNYMSSLTSTSTASLSSLAEDGIQDLGVFTLRKRYYDLEIVPGSLTATASGVNFGGTSIAGDYYDSGSGALIRKSDDTTVGVMLPDDGMFVVTSSNIREIATAITSVTYRTKVLNTTLNVFCKCSPDQMNFTLNPTVFMQNSISASTDTIGANIYQAYNNILVHSSITGATGRAKILSGLVSSGVDFSPYITSVGLYDDNNDLLAIAKFTSPVKKPTDLPMTFKLQIDV